MARVISYGEGRTAIAPERDDIKSAYDIAGNLLGGTCALARRMALLLHELEVVPGANAATRAAVADAERLFGPMAEWAE